VTRQPFDVSNAKAKLRVKYLAKLSRYLARLSSCAAPKQKRFNARDKPVTHTRSIFGVAGKASAQGSLFDEDAHGESAKDQQQNKKAEP
jgi:predicted pyridoxine 5'-phosphate oxidase superfamily flavin-nucleotide-binding protein